jgi:DNA replicative helicase MCM subunit Mcm2 (Cdc46/Mcm family)
MIKGITVKCMNCNKEYTRIYDKPELFESFVPIEKIKKCVECKTGDYLGQPKLKITNAVVAELKDENTFSEIDPLRIILFGDGDPRYDNTLNIDRHVGEPILVTGDIFNINIGKGRESKVVAYLYVKHLVNYLSRQELELTHEDIEGIHKFVNDVGPDNVIDKLTEMFATSVIDNTYVKKGLLLVAASTSLDKRSKKLHAILVGDPGLAKSELLKHAVGLVPNSRYENVQFATGKSLTAIVSKEEGDTHILRIGPIPQAKGAIAALNEIGRMTGDDQVYMLDSMQEQEFTTNKFGLNFHVDAPTAIIGSANPVGGSWKAFGDDSIDLDQIPMIKPLIDRFDLVFVFKDTKDESYLIEYADKKSEMEDSPPIDNTEYLMKHIMYSKQQPKPIFTDEAKIMLNQYFVKIKSQNFGSPRIRETIYRIAQNIARLKLKTQVDAADAQETMTFYNVILQQLGMIVSLPSNPKDITYNECLSILEESSFPIAYEEVLETACKRNPHVNKYISKSLKLRENVKVRYILDMLTNHSHVKVIQMKPTVLQWVNELGKDIQDNKTMVKAPSQACDPCDLCDPQIYTPTEKIIDKNTLIHEDYEGENTQNDIKTTQKHC